MGGEGFLLGSGESGVRGATLLACPSPSASAPSTPSSSISTASSSTPSRSTSAPPTPSWPARGSTSAPRRTPASSASASATCWPRSSPRWASPTTPTTTSTRPATKSCAPSAGRSPPPPGARELIERLADHDVPRAVGSSSVHAWVDQILTNLGVSAAFPDHRRRRRGRPRQARPGHLPPLRRAAGRPARALRRHRGLAERRAGRPAGRHDGDRAAARRPRPRWCWKGAWRSSTASTRRPATSASPSTPDPPAQLIG